MATRNSWAAALQTDPTPELSADEQAWLGMGSDIVAERKAARDAAAMVAKTCAIRPFPATATRVMELTATTEKHVREVVRVIETDPTLATRLLRYVNSAACGLKMRCKSLYHAVTLLGPQRIRELVTSTALLSMFERGDDLSTSILEHAAVTGALARIIGERFGLPSEEMLTCGLLHDLGKLMMLDAHDDHYASMLDLASGDDDVLCQLERDEYGFDHAVLAGQMLLKWNIPTPIPRVVSWHHQAGRAHAAGGKIAMMVEVLRFSDLVAEALSSCKPRDFARAEIAATATAAYLDMDPDTLARLWPSFTRAAEESRALFHGEEVPLSELDAADIAASPARKPHTHAPKHGPAPEIRCAFCNETTFGRECGLCHRAVCDAHEPGMGFCAGCEAEFAATPDPLTNMLTGGLLIGAAAAAMLIGFAIYFDVDMSAAIGASLAWCAVNGTSAAVRRWMRRRNFRPSTDEATAPARLKTAVVRAEEFEAPLVEAAVVDPEGKRMFGTDDLSGLVPQYYQQGRNAADATRSANGPSFELPSLSNGAGDAYAEVDIDNVQFIERHAHVGDHRPASSRTHRAALAVLPRNSSSVPYDAELERSARDPGVPLLAEWRTAMPISTLVPPAPAEPVQMPVIARPAARVKRRVARVG